MDAYADGCRATSISTGHPTASLRGSIVQQADAGYDDARKLYNAMIDKRPKLIARCIDAADVIAAVNFGAIMVCRSRSAAVRTMGPDLPVSTTGW